MADGLLSLPRLLDALFANAPVGLVFYDRDLRYIRVNDVIARINRRPAEEHVGRTIRDIRPDLAEIVEPRLRRVIESGTADTDVSLIEQGAGDDRIATAAIYYPVTDDEGRVEAVGVIVLDVTAAQRSDDELLHGQRLEALGTLAGGVAHDFNNLLTAIGGHARLALEQLSAGPVRDDVELVVRSAERAAGLVRQLLAFGRRSRLRLQPVSVNATLLSLETMLRPLLGSQVELSLRTAPDAGHVLADPVQLEQVVVNLVVNARDALDGGSRIAIETFRRGDRAGFSVRDTGSGMDPATAERAFEPFFTTKQAGHGTGLGLSTVYGIVTQSGGEVTIDSSPGAGTTVTVLLPVAAPATAGPEPATAQLAARGETVLLVEDDESVRRMARRALAGAGYAVLEAAGAHEALGVVDRLDAAPGVLVTDVDMPRLRGPALARRIRERFPTVRVLLVSGYADPEETAGFALLEKPFEPDRLLAAVAEALADGGAR